MRRIVARPRHRRWRLAMAANVALSLAAAAAIALARPDDRFLLAPAFAAGELVALFFSVLWARDGIAPIFECGSLCVLATAAYAIFPLVGFYQMHGQWYINADNRLFRFPFVASELGALGWWYFTYLAAFVAVYLAVRGGAAVRSTAFQMPSANGVAAVAVLYAALYALKVALKIIYGYDTDVSYVEGYKVAQALERMPYVLIQVTQNLLAALMILEQGVMILLLAQWRHWWARILTATWIAFELVTRSLQLGSRTSMVLLLLTTGVLYHRMVRPLSFRVVAVCGAVLIVGFMVLGSIRNLQGSNASAADVKASVFMGTNEFQGLYVTAFDLQQRKETGTLEVPWQVYASELEMLLPSQIAPFEKIEPGSWYIDVIGMHGVGTGFMFGGMSQAVLGLGRIECVLRGAALALCLALLHRWYVRRAVHFWPTFFYVFMGIYIYYTIRATTFWFLYFILYRFIPLFVAAKLLELLLSRVRAGRRVSSPAAPAG